MEKILNLIFKEVFADSQRFDPVKNFNFAVDFSWRNGDNFMSSNFGFNKVSGLNMDIDVVEYREGGDNISVRKSAGLAKFDPITLEKGLTANTEMWDAFTRLFSVTDGSEAGTEASDLDSEGYRGTITLDIKNRRKKTVATYEVYNAWISSYGTGDLDAQGNSVVVEKIVIQNEGIRRIK